MAERWQSGGRARGCAARLVQQPATRPRRACARACMCTRSSRSTRSGRGGGSGRSSSRATREYVVAAAASGGVGPAAVDEAAA